MPPIALFKKSEGRRIREGPEGAHFGNNATHCIISLHPHSAQATWRRKAAQAQLHAIRQASLSVQSAWRAKAAQAQLKEGMQAAVCVQAAARGLLARRSLAKQQAAAVCIQVCVGHGCGFALNECVRAVHVFVCVHWCCVCICVCSLVLFVARSCDRHKMCVC